MAEELLSEVTPESSLCFDQIQCLMTPTVGKRLSEAWKMALSKQSPEDKAPAAMFAKYDSAIYEFAPRGAGRPGSRPGIEFFHSFFDRGAGRPGRDPASNFFTRF